MDPAIYIDMMNATQIEVAINVADLAYMNHDAIRSALQLDLSPVGGDEAGDTIAISADQLAGMSDDQIAARLGVDVTKKHRRPYLWQSEQAC